MRHFLERVAAFFVCGAGMGGTPSELQFKAQAALAKVPEIGNRDISNGLALWAIDKYVYPNKYVKATAKAALVQGAVRFGRRGFKLGGSDEVGGWDDAIDVTDEGSEISGVID